MKRRLLSALLAMAMLLTMVPAAFAVDNDPGGETGGESGNTVSISVGESTTLMGANSEEIISHSWEIESGSDFISLVGDTTGPTVTVTGVAEGEAKVIHR